MKKSCILKNAFYGGCLGLILSGLGIIVYRIVSEGFTEEVTEDILGYIGTFLIFAFWFAIFSIVFYKKGYEVNKMPIEQRKKLLKKSRLYIIIVEFLTVIIGTVLIIIKVPIEIPILIFAMSISLLIWLLGAHLGYLNLKAKTDDRE